MTKDQIFEVIEENFNILAENNSGTTKIKWGRQAPPLNYLDSATDAFL